MNILKSSIFAIVISGIAASPVNADDGKTIYNQNCTGCHGTEVFTRPNRRVKNLGDLKNRIRQCSYAIEAKWFDSEINAVTEYLNSQFYKF